MKENIVISMKMGIQDYTTGFPPALASLELRRKRAGMTSRDTKFTVFSSSKARIVLRTG